MAKRDNSAPEKRERLMPAGKRPRCDLTRKIIRAKLSKEGRQGIFSEEGRRLDIFTAGDGQDSALMVMNEEIGRLRRRQNEISQKRVRIVQNDLKKLQHLRGMTRFRGMTEPAFAHKAYGGKMCAAAVPSQKPKV